MKTFKLGLVQMGRKPNTMSREVTECLLDVLYAPKPQQGVGTADGRKRMKVARKLEDAQDRERSANPTWALVDGRWSNQVDGPEWNAGVVVLEDEEHAVLKKACDEFLSVMPDHGLYEAFDRVAEATDPPK